MSNNLATPRRIAIATHPSLPESEVEASRIVEFLKDQGIDNVLHGSIYDAKLRSMAVEGMFDVLIAIGGDGTMLRAGHLCASIRLPILGVNLGNVGFLAELQADEWREKLPLLFEGQYRLEERMMMRAEHWRGERRLSICDVLNEVVVGRGKAMRPIQVQAEVDGYMMAVYVADGLIASTPTGSTAYALAVGGPIMPPELNNILVIPIAPHLSVDRAIILPRGAQVMMTLLSAYDAVISVDGQAPVDMEEGDRVCVRAESYSASFVRFGDKSSFYRNLSMHMVKNFTTNSGE